MPAPVAPEIMNTGPFQRSRRTMSLARLCASSGSSRSILLISSQRSLVARSAANFLSSATMVRASLTGSASRIRRRDIDEMQQHPGALQMLQEADAETRAFGGALDKPRNVRHDEAAARPHGDHAQIRVQRRERVIRDFGPRRGYGADEGGFAGIRQPEQPHIRDQLQFEQQARASRPAGPGRPCAGSGWCST